MNALTPRSFMNNYFVGKVGGPFYGEDLFWGMLHIHILTYLWIAFLGLCVAHQFGG